MKRIINRIQEILKDNSGETIVEAVVAFALLSVMLVVFAQGLASATTAETIASDNRKKADDTMIALQEKLATENVVREDGSPATPVSIRRYVYKVNGTNYIVYEADN